MVCCGESSLSNFIVFVSYAVSAALFSMLIWGTKQRKPWLRQLLSTLRCRSKLSSILAISFIIVGWFLV
jgi:hypothetical protein